MELGVLQGLAAFRWAAWAWLAVVFVLERDRVDDAWLALVLIASALAVTSSTTALLRSDWRRLLSWPFVCVELAVGVALVVGDGWVHQGRETGQALGATWPLIGILVAGVAFGTWAGAAAGVLMGSARLLGLVVEGDGPSGRKILALLSTVVFWVLIGAVAGRIVQLLGLAEREVSMVRAREEVARELHDGVLQTLALVERRTSDPTLARLARDQERDLRSYLFGDRQAGPTDLAAALRAAASRFEQTHGGLAQVLVPDDLPALSSARVEALAGAVGEALTNAAKHGGAGSVTVYAEPDGDGVFCSVKDDGCGFDVAAATEGVGLRSSIRGRMAEVGGRAAVVSRPGGGAEVQLWLP